jgi:S1-C subfamily serine protease
MKNDKILIGIGVFVLIAGVVIGAAGSVPRAHANPVTDFLSNLVAPFTGTSATSTPTPAAANVPLYQPAVDYENAVVAAVKNTSAAVVSITISENVPVVKQCATNPFQDLPPQFQQFFGNDFGGMTQPCDSGKTTLQAVGGGSGFIISSDGLILTNKHVVSDAKAQYSVLLENGKNYSAKVLARDPSQDLAVLKIDASGLPTVTLGDSASLELGQSAIAIGNALGEFTNTVSVGVISGLARTVTAGGGLSGGSETIHGVIHTDAAINPGNSGGPLLNLRGEVVGINTAVASDAQSIGFAIPINQAKRDIASVESSGQIQAPYLGVRYMAITPDVAKQQNLPMTSGALVRGSDTGPAVAPNSPAANAGIEAEDIITAVNGQAIDASHDLSTTVSQFNVGQAVTVTINRGGKIISLQVTLAARPAGSQ